METNIEQMFKKYTNEVKDHVDILKEHFDSQVKLIAEQYSSIIKRLNNHDEKFARIEKNIEIMKVDISFIKSGLQKKVDLENFEALEKRVALLEAKSQM